MPASGPDDNETASRARTPAKAGQRKGDSARADRLEAALRENLKRRKAAARARAPDETKSEAPEAKADDGL